MFTIYFPQSLFKFDITDNEVKNAIDKLKVKKATGFDNLSNELLKQPVMFSLIYNLLFTCFKQGLVPSEWQKSIIKPIPKCPNADPRVPMNYRGISLLSCVCKLYSSILNERLVFYLETCNLLAEEQNGFRRKRACIDRSSVDSGEHTCPKKRQTEMLGLKERCCMMVVRAVTSAPCHVTTAFSTPTPHPSLITPHHNNTSCGLLSHTLSSLGF